MSRLKYPLLFKVLCLYIFFLPFRGVQIPIGVVGFEINPSRILSVIAIGLLFISACVDVRFVRRMVRSERYSQPFVSWMFIYFLLSILHYYVLVVSGKTILFGTGEAFFLRNWQGRPFAQIISFITYGLVPFYLVKYYAQSTRFRLAIERVLISATLLLLYFGCVQVVTYIFIGEPLIGRQLLESKYDLGSITLFGIPFYRANSLGGEPRDFGTFLLGAIPFYLYVGYGHLTWKKKINIILMVMLFFLTTSNSAFLALAIFVVVVAADTLYRRRARIRFKYIRLGIFAVLIISLMFRAKLVSIIGERSITMVQAIHDQLETSEVQPLVAEQTSNIVVLYYLLNITQVSPITILFGSGYSNFISPIAELYQRYFNRPLEDVGIFTSDSSATKLLIEGGFVGLLLYAMIFFRTLQLNTTLLKIVRVRNDVVGYNKVLLLRFAFIAFFIAGAIQNSFYYFIPMGVIIGTLNGFINSQRKDDLENNGQRNGGLLSKSSLV